jgi:hypothetical protein
MNSFAQPEADSNPDQLRQVARDARKNAEHRPRRDTDGHGFSRPDPIRDKTTGNLHRSITREERA